MLTEGWLIEALKEIRGKFGVLNGDLYDIITDMEVEDIDGKFVNGYRYGITSAESIIDELIRKYEESLNAR